MFRGILATRTIKNEAEKKIVAILTPFIPCSAKLPIISFFSSYFFKENSGIVALSFYLLAIVIVCLLSYIFKFLNKNEKENNYLSELPEYRLPAINQIIKDSFERVWDFVKRAGSIILLSSIVIWFLISFSFKLEYGVAIENSILANCGRKISWVFIPMIGYDSWEIAVCTIQGFVAKEQVISSMAIIAGIEGQNSASNILVNKKAFDFLTPVASYAFACFNLFSAPCFSAIGALKKTLGGTSKAIKVICFQTIFAYVLSCFIYLVFSKV